MAGERWSHVVTLVSFAASLPVEKPHLPDHENSQLPLHLHAKGTVRLLSTP